MPCYLRDDETPLLEAINHPRVLRTDEAFGIEKPFQSIKESAHLCPGFRDEGCGDEIPKDQELCTAHQKEEDDYYFRKAMEQDREEEIVAKASQYAYLRDERKARNGR